MAMTGGCFCGALRFEADGPIRMRGLCLCASCQKISGGAGNFFIGLDASGFRYTQGDPQRFQHPDRPEAPTREFCRTCGVHIAGRSPRAPDGMILKVGALDDPTIFDGPQFVIWTEDSHPFHTRPDGVPAFARFPTRPE
jgi:hypothetical protein